ncbi:hypothetical protein EDC02_5365 [Micromonospora sp. Llam0]|uniref:effector-associated constant component EACC1 n=1 Tax=Micromonospora sp. Llam0 TaxID=2485143 RepID=UPI000F49721F|nr:hypothetical protein [Micromonospora sp. Llam0]ROO63343.1 hypothetical protein EDC02_5365 [Micromonospora sp. Llam0]
MRIEVEGSNPTADLESLRDWFAEVDELRGRVDEIQAPAGADKLGPLLEALSVAAGSGGVAAAVAASVIAWLRTRAGVVRVRVERPDGTKVSVDATSVRTLSPEAVRAQVEQLLSAIEPPR